MKNNLWNNWNSIKEYEYQLNKYKQLYTLETNEKDKLFWKEMIWRIKEDLKILKENK